VLQRGAVKVASVNGITAPPRLFSLAPERHRAPGSKVPRRTETRPQVPLVIIEASHKRYVSRRWSWVCGLLRDGG
jgi:hypothetical protein